MPYNKPLMWCHDNENIISWIQLFKDVAKRCLPHHGQAWSRSDVQFCRGMAWYGLTQNHERRWGWSWYSQFTKILVKRTCKNVPTTCWLNLLGRIGVCVLPIWSSIWQHSTITWHYLLTKEWSIWPIKASQKLMHDDSSIGTMTLIIIVASTHF